MNESQRTKSDFSESGIDPTESWNSVLTPLSFLERSAHYLGDKTAVVFRKQRYDYATFYRHCCKMASALKSNGIRKGDRVAFLSRNRPELLQAHFAVPLAGGVLVAINTRLGSGEIKYILNHSGSKIAFIDEILLESLTPVRDSVNADFVTMPDQLEGEKQKESEPLGLSFDQFLSLGSPSPIKVDVQNDYDLISINYTSGTTGLPKGAMYHHKGAFLNAIGEALEHGLNCDSSYLWTLPMFHCNGWCFTWSVVSAGAKSVCLDKLDPALVYELINEENVTHLCGAPTVYIMLLDHMKKNGLRFPHRVHMVIAGAPPAPTTIRQVTELGGEISHVYGLTETYGPHSICEWRQEWNKLPLDELSKLKSRQGIPYVGFQMDVFDKDNNPVSHNGRTVGEVVMKGHNVVLGYYKDPERTKESFRNGWFYSGDAAIVHPNGYIEIVDRYKDIIITGGENVSSIEVEKVIMELSGVRAVAVFGTPDEKWGEIVTARIETKDGATLAEEEVVAHCRARIAHFKCPRIVEFKAIPWTATGKMQKYLLRRQVQTKDRGT